MSEWIKHDGGPCPVDANQFVQVKCFDGISSASAKAKHWDNWWHWRCNKDNRIIAYRPVEIDQ